MLEANKLKGGISLREHQEKVPFDFIIKKFAEMDPESIAKTLGIPYYDVEKCFELNLMGQDYKIVFPTGEVFNSNLDEVTSYVLKTIFIRYLVNGKGTALSKNYISYKEIQDGQVYYTNFYKRTILRLADVYNQDPVSFLYNLNTLDANILTKGDLSFSFDFMKNVNFQFILYDEDEEFKATANILMDQNVEDYFNAEDLALVVDVAIEFFIHGEVPKDLGMYFTW